MLHIHSHNIIHTYLHSHAHTHTYIHTHPFSNVWCLLCSAWKTLGQQPFTRQRYFAKSYSESYVAFWKLHGLSTNLGDSSFHARSRLNGCSRLNGPNVLRTGWSGTNACLGLHTSSSDRCGRCIYTQKLLSTDAFPHRSIHPETLWHIHAYTHRSF